MLAEEQVIGVLKALADPNRLRLFELLLCSDRTNSELMNETGLRQNLLSHHLNILAEAELIDMVQSIGDARRHYYSANLLKTQTVAEWWAQHTPPLERPLPCLKKPRRILFLCLRNTSRSLMAEAIAHKIAPNSLIAVSAGYAEQGVELPEVTRQVLEENGVSAMELHPKLYSDLPDKQFDIAVTVCDIVHENSIPAEVRDAQYIHWSLRDPVNGVPDPMEQLELARSLYADIELRLALLVRRLALAEALD